MQRDQVLALVKAKAAEVIPNLDISTLDTGKSLREYGASSLDLVELVSMSMRELKVKVPRSELNKVTSIDALVDLLHKSALEKIAPQ